MIRRTSAGIPEKQNLKKRETAEKRSTRMKENEIIRGLLEAAFKSKNTRILKALNALLHRKIKEKNKPTTLNIVNMDQRNAVEIDMQPGRPDKSSP